MSTKNRNFDMEEVTSLEKNKKFDYIRFVWSDIHGIPKGLSIPRRHLRKAIDSGVSAFMGMLMFGIRSDLNLVKELEENQFANYVFKAKSGTFRQVSEDISKNQRKIGQLLCETFRHDPELGLTHVDGCSRYVARRMINKLEQNFCLTIKVSFEAEFSVYENEPRKPVFTGSDSCSVLRLAKFENYLYGIEERLRSASIDISSISIEHGDGQFELGMEPLEGIQAADSMFLIKQLVKEASQELNWTATCMSKPFKDSSTTGMHLNHSLWCGSVNKFSDRTSSDGMSSMMKFWVAGLIEHGEALSALCCPTVNCYRRMHHFMGPDKIDWGMDNRLSTFRLKNKSPSETYVENRLPSGACNPYLALAATVASGIDGINRKLELPREKNDKIQLDPSGKLISIGETNGRSFPFTLEEALCCLERDTIIVDALGEQVVRWFCQCKRSTEIKLIDGLSCEEEKFEKERELYFEFL